MKISVITTILNEEFFLHYYLACIATFADEFVTTDGGSNDKSLDLLHLFAKKYPKIRVDIKETQQAGKPYTEDWKQGNVLNDLLDRCTNEYVVLLDADELVDADEILSTVQQLSTTNKSLVNFMHIPFWGDLHHVRCSTPNDPRWYGTPIARIIKRSEWKYMEVEHHSAPCHRTHGRSDKAWQTTVESSIRLYHLHYGFGNRGIKINDNRAGDLGDSKYRPKFDLPDFNRPTGIFGSIVVKPYIGPWNRLLMPDVRGDRC